MAVAYLAFCLTAFCLPRGDDFQEPCTAPPRALCRICVLSRPWLACGRAVLPRPKRDMPAVDSAVFPLRLSEKSFDAKMHEGSTFACTAAQGGTLPDAPCTDAVRLGIAFFVYRTSLSALGLAPPDPFCVQATLTPYFMTTSAGYGMESVPALGALGDGSPTSIVKRRTLTLDRAEEARLAAKGAKSTVQDAGGCRNRTRILYPRAKHADSSQVSVGSILPLFATLWPLAWAGQASDRHNVGEHTACPCARRRSMSSSNSPFLWQYRYAPNGTRDGMYCTIATVGGIFQGRKEARGDRRR